MNVLTPFYPAGFSIIIALQFTRATATIPAQMTVTWVGLVKNKKGLFVWLTHLNKAQVIYGTHKHSDEAIRFSDFHMWHLWSWMTSLSMSQQNLQYETQLKYNSGYIFYIFFTQKHIIIIQTRSVDDKDKLMIAAELRLTQLRKEI